MSDLLKNGISLHLLLSIMLMCVYIINVIIDKDELEEKAQSYALKYSTLLSMIAVTVYTLYKAMTGNVDITIHVLLAFVNTISILYLLLYFLYLRGVRLEFKIKNMKLINLILDLSICISVICSFTQFFDINIFQTSYGYFRIDTLIAIINFMFISFIIGLMPSKKLSREEYKKREETSKKVSKILVICYVLFVIGIAAYMICKH